MIIGGEDHVVGSRPMKIGQIIQTHSAKRKPVRVELKRNGTTVTVSATARGNIPDAVVQLVMFHPKATVNVRRGENAGRTLDYHNVVQKLVRVGTWDGRATYSGSFKVPRDAHVAVLIQQSGAGPILGAAQLR